MPNRRRSTVFVAVLATAALALTGCSLLPKPPSGGPTDSPAGVEKFYTQELSWTEEGDQLDSTTVEVPLDWAEPDGDTVEIAVMRHHAEGDALGSLLMNPGGPGGSGYDYVRDYAQYLVSPDVLAKFDLIGFDPRGVNHSNPVTCYTDPGDRDQYLYGTYDEAYGSEGWIDELTQREKDYAAACDYILNRFVSLNQHETKQIYTHFTCATDTTQIRFVMAAVNGMFTASLLTNSKS